MFLLQLVLETTTLRFSVESILVNPFANISLDFEKETLSVVNFIEHNHNILCFRSVSKVNTYYSTNVEHLRTVVIQRKDEISGAVS